MTSNAQYLGAERATPVDEKNADGTHWHSHLGLTKRELFALAAMHGILACPATAAETSLAEVASMSVTSADALLTELSR